MLFASESSDVCREGLGLAGRPATPPVCSTADRRQLAETRQREPIVAAAITTTGLLLACLAPLVIAWLCLRQAGKSNADADVAEMLTLDLTADEPLLAAASAPRPLLERQPGNQDAGGA